MDVNKIAPFAVRLRSARDARTEVVRKRSSNQRPNGSQMEAGSYTVSKYAIDAVTRVLAAEFSEATAPLKASPPA